ncbi:MAG TPA: SDR family NAD(P)-dependent oxidoreductase [Anaerolineales bacterium]|nr:SDR family NAD(P)-dependent oxidoreductase [Anaerolineales bacterium]
MTPVAFITGASQGLARQIALALAAEGVRIAMNDLNPLALDQAAQEIHQLGGEVLCVHADVVNKMALQTALYQVIEQWGRIDILVNGAYAAPRSELTKLDEYDWDRTLDVNLKGAFVAIQTLARFWEKADATETGTVVNLLAGAPIVRAGKPTLAEVASQWGVLGLTQTAARELANQNVRVFAITTPAGRSILAGQTPVADGVETQQQVVEQVKQLCLAQDFPASGSILAVA